MVDRRSVLLVATGVVCGLLVGGTTTAVAVSSQKSVKVCVTKSGVVRAANAKGKCPKKTKKRPVAVRGPKGARGKAGARGPVGKVGPTGPAGSATAYGVVLGADSLYYRSPNAVEVRNPATGIYCVRFTAPIPAARVAAASTQTWFANPGVQVVARPGAEVAGCADGELAAAVFNAGVASNHAFSFLIP